MDLHGDNFVQARVETIIQSRATPKLRTLFSCLEGVEFGVGMIAVMGSNST